MVSREDAIDLALKAVSDTTRRSILGLLQGRQLSVLEIAEEFPMSRPAISKHLKILKEAGLVLETPSGRQRLYALERSPLELLATWLAGFHEGRPSGRSQIARPRFRPQPRQAGSVEQWRVW